MTKIKNPILPEHYEKCKIYLNKWQTLYGLQDWRIYLRYPSKTKAQAETDVETEDRVAYIDLGKSMGAEEVTDFALESLMVHELGHVWLAPLWKAYRGDNQERQDTEEHRCVNLLEKLLMEKYYGKLTFKE